MLALLPRDRDSAPRPRLVALLVYPGMQILDATGPLAVFETASRLLSENGGMAEPAYRTVILAPSAGPLASSAGLVVMAEREYRAAPAGIDTLLVAGGQGMRHAIEDRDLLGWLGRQAKQVRRFGSVCTGAFLLAEAGLLAGRRATTHWAYCRELAERHPDIRVEADAIYVRDGALYTSAGVTAGMDLALALVEEDWGRELALAAARRLVMFVKRPGGQSQFSAQLAAQAAERPRIRALQDWLLEHLAEDLSVGVLASRAAMSPRNFARVFAREAGMTPAAFVESARLEAARRRLEEGEATIEAIAAATGFGGAERLRRAFQRRLGVSPQGYRQRFRSAGGEGIRRRA
jgi:transcriptional regulator GlxA family with amidase domain